MWRPIHRKLSGQNVSQQWNDNGQGQHSRSKSKKQSCKAQAPTCDRVQLWERAPVWAILTSAEAVAVAYAAEPPQHPGPNSSIRTSRISSPAHPRSLTALVSYCRSWQEMGCLIAQHRVHITNRDVMACFDAAKTLQGRPTSPYQVDSLQQAAIAVIHTFTPQQICQILSDCSRLDLRLPRLVHALAAHLTNPATAHQHQQLHQFSPHQLTHSLRLFALLGHRHPTLYTAYFKTIINASANGWLSMYTTESLAAVIAAVRRAPVVPDTQQLLQCITIEAGRPGRVEDLAQRDPFLTTTFVRDLTLLGVNDEVTLNAFLAHLSRPDVMVRLNVRCLANVLGSLAAAKVQDPVFADAIGAQCMRQRMDFHTMPQKALVSVVQSACRVLSTSQSSHNLCQVVQHIVTRTPEGSGKHGKTMFSLQHVPNYQLCRLLDCMARARAAVGAAFPMSSIAAVMSELMEPARRDTLLYRDLTILLKLKDHIPEYHTPITALLDSAQYTSASIHNHGYMVMGDALGALRVGAESRAGAAEFTAVTQQIKQHLRNPAYVADQAAQLPLFISQATMHFIEANLGHDVALLDAISAPLTNPAVLRNFTGRDLVQTSYNLFRLRHRRPAVARALSREMSRAGLLDTLNEQELCMALMAVCLTRSGSVRLVTDVAQRLTQADMIPQVIQHGPGMNMMLIALEEAGCSFKDQLGGGLYAVATDAVSHLLYASQTVELSEKTLYYVLHVMGRYRVHGVELHTILFTQLARHGDDAALQTPSSGADSTDEYCAYSSSWLCKTWQTLRLLTCKPPANIVQQVARVSTPCFAALPGRSSVALAEALKTAADVANAPPDFVHYCLERIQAEGVADMREYGATILFQALVVLDTEETLLPQCAQRLVSLLQVSSARFAPLSLLNIISDAGQRQESEDCEAVTEAGLKRVIGEGVEGVVAGVAPFELLRGVQAVSGLRNERVDGVEECMSVLVSALGSDQNVQFLRQNASGLQMKQLVKAIEGKGLTGHACYDVLRDIANET